MFSFLAAYICMFLCLSIVYLCTWFFVVVVLIVSVLFLESSISAKASLDCITRTNCQLVPQSVYKLRSIQWIVIVLVSSGINHFVGTANNDTDINCTDVLAFFSFSPSLSFWLFTWLFDTFWHLTRTVQYIIYAPNYAITRINEMRLTICVVNYIDWIFLIVCTLFSKHLRKKNLSNTLPKWRTSNDRNERET